MSVALFTIEPRRWYAWQMMPGYTTSPFFSPIWIRSLRPLQSGRQIFRLEFWNVAYAEGVQDFKLTLRILKRTSQFLAADIEGQPERMAIVSPITVEWLRILFPERAEKQRAVGTNDPQVLLNHMFAPLPD